MNLIPVVVWVMLMMMMKFSFLCGLKGLYLLLAFVLVFTFLQIHLTRTPSAPSLARGVASRMEQSREELGSKLRDSVVFLPLKDLRFKDSAMEGNTWFMSSVNSSGKEMKFPSRESKGRVLCIKGRNTVDGSWNSYALAWPGHLPSNAVRLRGTSFVCDNFYIYDNIFHGLSALMPFVEWYLNGECRFKPERWVLFHKGELRVSVISWLREVMEATFDGKFRIKYFDKSNDDDDPVCFEKALVVKHSFRMSRRSEETVKVFDLVRCKARTYCDVSSDSDVANKRAAKIGMTLLVRNGTRAFTNLSTVIGIFRRACRKVEGCRLVVAYPDNLVFCEQVKLMSETDVLVSPHGAQLTNLVLMDRNSSVMELFPKGWLEHAGIGQYVYQWLAASSGMRHRGVWRDPVAHDCSNAKNADLCVRTSFKDRRIGYNESYFASWAAKVLDEARRREPATRDTKGTSELCGCRL